MPGKVTSVKVDLYRDVIKATLDTDVGKEVMVTTVATLNRARVMCPVRTGNLRASHNIQFRFSQNRILGEVYTKVKYALPVHDGRRAIVIFPRKKKALAFVWKGQPMVRKWVHQPGRPGRPWLRDALREVAAQRGYKMQSTAAIDQGGG